MRKPGKIVKRVKKAAGSAGKRLARTREKMMKKNPLKEGWTKADEDNIRHIRPDRRKIDLRTLPPKGAEVMVTLSKGIRSVPKGKYLGKAGEKGWFIPEKVFMPGLKAYVPVPREYGSIRIPVLSGEGTAFRVQVKRTQSRFRRKKTK